MKETIATLTKLPKFRQNTIAGVSLVARNIQKERETLK